MRKMGKSVWIPPGIPHKIEPPGERYFKLLTGLARQKEVTHDCIAWVATEVGVVFRKHGCNAQATHIVRRSLEGMKRNGCLIEGDIGQLKIKRIAMTEHSQRRLEQMSLWRQRERTYQRMRSVRQVKSLTHRLLD